MCVVGRVCLIMLFTVILSSQHTLLAQTEGTSASLIPFPQTHSASHQAFHPSTLCTVPMEIHAPETFGSRRVLMSVKRIRNIQELSGRYRAGSEPLSVFTQPQLCDISHLFFSSPAAKEDFINVKYSVNQHG